VGNHVSGIDVGPGTILPSRRVERYLDRFARARWPPIGLGGHDLGR
jgi:hypothetical protein